MKILITGGAGFIASHIQDAYLQAGHEVVVVDDLSHGRRENLNPRARFYQVDIRSPEVAQIIALEKPEVVNHHAAQMEVKRSVDDPLFDAEVNLLGGLRVLKAAVDAGARKLIFSSSGGTVYGEQQVFPATEEHRTDPLSPYGVAKLAFEKYLNFFHLHHGIEYVCLRYANIYGPRQDPHGEAGVVAIFAEKMLAGRAPCIYGTGTNTRDYVFVDDVVDANVRALGDVPSGAYNIGTATETDVLQLVRILRELTGCTLEAQHVAARPGEQLRSTLSPRLAGEKLGWKPRMALREGLARTVEFFRGKVA
jgi:UDP-glucose 4-epimerase